MRNFQKPDGHVTDEFAKLMVQLASGYASMSGKLSEPMIRIYAVGLGDLTLEQVRGAMGVLLRESTFWPSVADIRREALGSPQDAAVLAWVGLRRAAGEVGSWASLTCEDGLAGVALEAVFGTWPEFCRMEEGPELNMRRQEFLAVYRSLRGNRPAARLAGLCEVAGPVSGAVFILKAGGEIALDQVATDRQLEA